VGYITGRTFSYFQPAKTGESTMPFMTAGKRDYKKELQWEKTKKPNRVKDRAARNSARSQMGLKVGDPRHVDHVKPLDSGGGSGRSNLRVVSAQTNLRKEALAKKRKAK
jgi:5-methylcytosine-specific restriction endonuclease McrA